MSRRRQMVIDVAQERVLRTDLIEHPEYAIHARRAVLRVHAVGAHGLLLAGDRVLGPPVPMALHQRVRTSADGHLAARAVDGRLHGVAVVEQFHRVLAPSERDLRHAFPLTATGQVDGRLRMARGADRVALVGVHRPRTRVVGVPRLVAATADLAPVEGLRRAEIAAGDLPAHGRLELVILCFRERLGILQHPPVDSLGARRRGEGSIVGPILSQGQALVHFVEVDRACEIGGRGAGKTPVCFMDGQCIFEGLQERILGADLIEDAEDAVHAAGAILGVHAMDDHGHLVAVDGML
mmetsp:Transcript_28437/g.82311  ORF Transcript_28437/g.82311 Transcript_28437/m.82311 type:complete len:295 (+) Transcript_28437:1248-2132(+)